MTCRNCARLGHCDPNIGRGQGRDCERSKIITRRIFGFDRQPPALSRDELAAGPRSMHVEDGGTWVTESHRVLRLRPEPAATPAPKPSRWPAIVGGAIGLLLACAAAAAVAGFGFNPF